MALPKPQQLTKIKLLSGLSPAELEQVVQQIRWRTWPAGHCFVSFRDESRDVYFVLEGKVRVTIFSESGREVSFRDLEAGTTFGELSAIDQGPRSANVVAVTNVQVGSVTAPEFVALVRRYPAAAEATLRHLTTLVRSLSSRVYELSEPVPIRICIELIRMAEERTTDGRTAHLRPSPKHQEIANRMITHREAVSRMMSQLGRLGIVERGRGEIIVRDIPRLKAFRERLIDEKDS